MLLNQMRLPLRFPASEHSKQFFVESPVSRIGNRPVHTYIIPEIHPAVRGRVGYSGFVRVFLVS